MIQSRQSTKHHMTEIALFDTQTSEWLSCVSLTNILQDVHYPSQRIQMTFVSSKRATKNSLYEKRVTYTVRTHFLKISAAIGIVEFTGFEIIATRAFGQYLATAAARSLTIPTDKHISETRLICKCISGLYMQSILSVDRFSSPSSSQLLSWK